MSRSPTWVCAIALFFCAFAATAAEKEQTHPAAKPTPNAEKKGPVFKPSKDTHAKGGAGSAAKHTAGNGGSKTRGSRSNLAEPGMPVPPGHLTPDTIDGSSKKGSDKKPK